MQMRKKTIAIATVIFLLLTMTASLVMVPDVAAHTPVWNIPSYAYLVPSPNPVGVGQKIAIVMWVDTPLPSAAVTNDIRRHDYKLTITKPDLTTEIHEWPIVTDSTSIQYFQYVPDQIGNYSLFFEYKGQTYTWSGTYQNDYFMPVNKTATFTVQQEPLP